MADITSIEWCDSTFNPWFGCTAVSAACDHCYAESWAKRSGLVQWGNAPRRLASDAKWKEPLRWQREAAAFFAQHGRRRRVFCASLADVFDNQVDPFWRERLWSIILITPDIDWLLLTKRPQNIAKMLPAHWGEGWKNVWLGTTVENQEEANRRIPKLCDVPARLRFLSCEPLLGPLDLERVLYRKNHYESGADHYVDVLRGGFWSPKPMFRASQPGEPKVWFTNHSDMGRIGWVIVGGESGHKARPSHPDWFISLRDQCRGHPDGPPLASFLFKQWGNWAPAPWKLDRELGETVDEYKAHSEARAATHAIRQWDGFVHKPDHKPWSIERAGIDAYWAGIRHYKEKKSAGRLLAGVEHNEFPEVTAHQRSLL